MPAPGNGTDSGLTWAEGSLWVGQYRERRIHQIDPVDGRVLWTNEIKAFRGMNILTPIALGDRVFTSAYGGQSLALDLHREQGKH